MNKWEDRTSEVAYLLNPAFCSLIIYNVIIEYQKKSGNNFPFSLLYLILPLILHKNTRSRISSRTNMVVWLQKNPDVLVDFSMRARNLVVFTNEALEFLLHQKIMKIVNAKLSIVKKISKIKLDDFENLDQEISECLKKSKDIGRWFSKMISEENIYAAWGVKP